MPYQYQRTPFNTTQTVRMYQGCHGGTFNNQVISSARDIGFDGIQYGSQVFAVEDGTVVFIEKNSNCFSKFISSTKFDQNNRVDRNNQPNPNCGQANEVIVRGADGYFTSYVHVLPSSNLTVGSTVQVGTLLGTIDNSAITSGPHVHLARFKPNPKFDPNDFFASPYWQNGGTCKWTMFNVTGIDITPKNGWVLDEDSGTWYYYNNGIRQTNQFISTNGTWYYVNNIGAYTGSYYYFDNTRQYYRLWWTPTQRWYRWNGSMWVLES